MYSKQMNFLTKFILGMVATGLMAAHAQAQTMTYSLFQDPMDPLMITAQATPDFTGTISVPTGVFSLMLPAGTVTSPALPELPGTGNFTDINGSWAGNILTPAAYAAATGNPAADLAGFDIYGMVLQPGTFPTNLAVTAGTPVDLFSFSLPNNCASGTVEILTNDSAIQQAIFNAAFLNYNNEMSVGIGGASAADIYTGNDAVTAVLDCPLGNMPPDAVDDTAMTDEGTSVDIPVLGNDSDPDGALVPGSVTATDPPNGTVSVNPDGSVTYTPDAGFTGDDTFMYTVCDDGTPEECDTATVTVTVNPVQLPNQPPVAVDDTGTVEEGMSVDIPVLDNDSDPDGALVPGTVTATDPPNGTVSVNPDGSVTYTPDAGFTGDDTFMYTVCDDGTPQECDTATVTVTVTAAPNLPPVAVDDAVVVDEDSTDNVISILDNDSDPDGTLDPTSVTVTQPPNGTVTVNPDGTVNYTPDPDFNGDDTFTYTVCDDMGACDTATVTVTVNPLNDPPVANPDSASTPIDTEVVIDVSNNDTDPDDNLDLTSITITNPPANGSVTVNGDGTVTYTPNPGFAGNDSFEYEICDTDGECDTALVNVQMFVPRLAPVPTLSPISLALLMLMILGGGLIGRRMF